MRKKVIRRKLKLLKRNSALVNMMENYFLLVLNTCSDGGLSFSWNSEISSFRGLTSTILLPSFGIKTYGDTEDYTRRF